MAEASVPDTARDTSQQEQSEDIQAQAANTASGVNDQVVYVGSEIHRRVPVKGSGGVRATLEVVVRRATVWVSIVPYFSGEAILDVEKVDAVIRTLAQARDDARRMGSKGLAEGRRQAAGIKNGLP